MWQLTIYFFDDSTDVTLWISQDDAWQYLLDTAHVEDSSYPKLRYEWKRIPLSLSRCI